MATQPLILQPLIFEDPRVGDLGVEGDGVTHAHAALDAWLDRAINGRPGILPEGTWLLEEKLVRTISQAAALSGPLRLVGAGACRTTIKRADGTALGNFEYIIGLQNEAGVSIDVEVEGITFDHNARGNPMPLPIGSVVGAFVVGETITGGTSGATATVKSVAAAELGIHDYTNANFTDGETVTGGTSGATAVVGVAPSRFAWEQSASLALFSEGAEGIRDVRLRDVHFKDPLADGVLFSGNHEDTYRDILMSGVTSSDRGRVRSDVTLVGHFRSCNVNQVEVDKFEMEQEGTADSGLDNRLKMVNVHCRDTLDLAFDSDAPGVGELSNVSVDGLAVLADGEFKIEGGIWQLSQKLTVVRGSAKFHGTKLHALAGFAASTTGMVDWGDLLAPDAVEFDDCEFSADASLTTAEVPYYIWKDHGGELRARDCRFKGVVIPSARVRGGYYEFVDCDHEFAGKAVTIAGATSGSYTHEAHFYDNRMHHPNGYLTDFATPGAGMVVSVWMRGNWARSPGRTIWYNSTADIAAPRGSGTKLDFKCVDDFEDDAVPSGAFRKFVRGQRVYLRAPAAGGTLGWVCVSSGAPGTWKAMPALGA